MSPGERLVLVPQFSSVFHPKHSLALLGYQDMSRHVKLEMLKIPSRISPQHKLGPLGIPTVAASDSLATSTWAWSIPGAYPVTGVFPRRQNCVIDRRSVDRRKRAPHTKRLCCTPDNGQKNFECFPLCEQMMPSVKNERVVSQARIECHCLSNELST